MCGVWPESVFGRGGLVGPSLPVSVSVVVVQIQQFERAVSVTELFGDNGLLLFLSSEDEVVLEARKCARINLDSYEPTGRPADPAIPAPSY